VVMTWRVMNGHPTSQRIWEYVPENDFEMIPTVKMETRNPIESYFGSEFLAISNYCRVMAA